MIYMFFLLVTLAILWLIAPKWLAQNLKAISSIVGLFIAGFFCFIWYMLVPTKIREAVEKKVDRKQRPA